MLCAVNTNNTGTAVKIIYLLQWLTLMRNISVRRCQTVLTPAPQSSTRNPGGTGLFQTLGCSSDYLSCLDFLLH